MALSPVGPNALPGVSTQPTAGSVGTPEMPFSDLVRNLLQDVNSQQVGAQQSIQDLASGQADSLQGVVLNVAKSDLTFRLLMEIRDKVIASYQEIMRMQV